MLDQIHFKMAGPGCPSHPMRFMGTGLRTWLARVFPFLGQTLLATAILAQDPGHRRFADLGEVLFHFCVQMKHLEAGQVPGRGKQRWSEPLCTDVIQAFPDDQDHLLNS